MQEERRLAAQTDAVLVRHLRFLVGFKKLVERLEEEVKGEGIDQRRITKLINSLIVGEHHEEPIEQRLIVTLEEFTSILGSVERHIAISAPASVEKLEQAKRSAFSLLRLMIREERIDSLIKEGKKNISALKTAVSHLDKAIQADEALYKLVQGTEEVAERAEKISVENYERLIEELRNRRYVHVIIGPFIEVGKSGVTTRKIIGNNKHGKDKLSDFTGPVRRRFLNDIRKYPEGTCRLWVGYSNLFKAEVACFLFSKTDKSDRGNLGAYMLLIPPEDKEKIIPIIRENPRVMITLFEVFFPEYFAKVNSGRLSLDLNGIIFEE